MSETRKTLCVEKPVKLIFAGGFLGSGKTTALGGLAKRSIERGMRVGIITNDQSQNLADTLIVRHMLKELQVPVEEVVEGCFCCKFNDLINQMEKILANHPDVLMGEPVGSCTDFVAAVANPIKIHYRDAFRFAPFCTLVDPDRVRTLLLAEVETNFPEEVSYLFRKQLEEADIIVLNKIDLINPQERDRLLAALSQEFPGKQVVPISATRGDNLDSWLDRLISGKPGANTVLSQIDYDRYARAEAILGWLNSAVKLSAEKSLDAGQFLRALMLDLRQAFTEINAEIGHLKCVLTGGGRAIWTNLTHLSAEPTITDTQFGAFNHGTLLINARVKLEPESLEQLVRGCLERVCQNLEASFEVDDLQCFSPAYPNPPYLVRETVSWSQG